ncbi:MAG: sce7726 family protein [Simplicispira sp.]|nr:sce7726 family protein [Simplicispira sp.]
MTSPLQIKTTLKQWLITHRGHKPSDVFIEELCIFEKNNRADLVHANGALLGFEIKSAKDTLARWNAQHAAYQMVFDEVWLCCHSKHVVAALQYEDKSTGIMAIDDFGGLAVLREAKKNNKIDPYQLACLLWRCELESLCSRSGIGFTRKDKVDTLRNMCVKHVSLEELKTEVLVRLKERYGDYNSSSAEAVLVLNPPVASCSSSAQIC